METWTQIAATAAFHIVPLAVFLAVQLRADRRALPAPQVRPGRR